MLVVRDLSGTVDTEAELARQQRQTEMILRAAAEGVVGVDTDGRVVLVNPVGRADPRLTAPATWAARSCTRWCTTRAPTASRSRTRRRRSPTRCRSGRKHRVRGQVLWRKDGSPVPVDLTTAPVRDGDQLVGAVMTFTDRAVRDSPRSTRTSSRAGRAKRRCRLRQHGRDRARGAARGGAAAGRSGTRLAGASRTGTSRRGRHQQLPRARRLPARAAGRAAGRAGRAGRRPGRAAVARGQPDPAPPVGRLRADHHAHRQRAGLPAAGRGRGEAAPRRRSMLDAVVAAGVDGAVELIGPGRAQFAVHAPPIEAEVRRASGWRPRSPTSSRTSRASTRPATRPSSAGGYWTPRSWSRRRSAVTSYGSRCAGRTPGETRCTSRSCAASWRRTAACCRRTRCRA